MRRITLAVVLLSLAAFSVGAQTFIPAPDGGGTTFNGGTITGQLAVTPADNGTPLYLTSQAADTADGLTVLGGGGRGALIGVATANASCILCLSAPLAHTGNLLTGTLNSAARFSFGADGGLTAVGASDLSGGNLELPNGTASVAGDCDAAGEAGRIWIDTDATTGQQVYVCEGVAGWVQQGGGGAGANTALSNLAAVAINTSLISDTANTDDLGSATSAWRSAYFGTSAVFGTAANPPMLYGSATDGLLEQRNGTNPQIFRLYGTYTSSTNYEAACLKWDTLSFYMGTCKGATGSLRSTLITGSTISFVAGAGGGTDVSVDESVLVPAGNNAVALGKNNQNWSNLFLGTALIFGNNSTKLVEDDSGVLAQKNGNDDQQFRVYATNGGYYETGTISELITLSVAGATTDSTADLLPANSLIDAVGCRVTTTITTATDWSVGDPTIAARFSSANATLTAGTTSVGMNHMKGGVATDAAGPTQTSAAKLRITTTGTPGAGVIRCTTFYRTFVAPTS